MDSSRADLPEATTLELLASLQRRANALLAEVTSFSTFLHLQHKDKAGTVRHFKNSIQSEVKCFNKIAERIEQDGKSTIENEIEGEDNETSSQRLHALQSSNLPFYEAVWRTARRCMGVKALGQRVYWSSPPPINQPVLVKLSGTTHNGPAELRQRRNGVLVDIIADDGQEWIKVSTISEKRLLFEMAKDGWEGWEESSSSDEAKSSSNHLGPSSEDNNDRGGIELVRLARQLRLAANHTRVRFEHPRICIVLPNLREGRIDEVDAVLAEIRNTGAVVCCGEFSEALEVQANSLSTNADTNQFSKMLSSKSAALTSTLNIDCTVLLALISDISHLHKSSLPCPTVDQGSSANSFHQATSKQIETEEKSPLLQTELYPVFAGRKLVCTPEAAERMQEIVRTMGTNAEQARASIFLASGDYAEHAMSSHRLRDALKSYSVYEVPHDLQLPISIVDFDTDMVFSQELESMDVLSTASSSKVSFPTSVAFRTCQSMKLSAINRSVFIYGWYEDFTTVTSNRVVAIGLERTINSVLDATEMDTVKMVHGAATGVENVCLKETVEKATRGPKLWVCDTARSLIGKDKARKEG